MTLYNIVQYREVIQILLGCVAFLLVALFVALWHIGRLENRIQSLTPFHSLLKRARNATRKRKYAR